MTRAGSVGAALALAWLGSARVASAQPPLANNGQGMDTHLFRPAMDTKGLFVTNGANVLGKNDVSFGLVLDYGNTLLNVSTVSPGSPS